MSFQKAQIDDKGTVLAYIDSGALPGDTYTTLICVHGHSYHAHNFSRLLPLASKHDLRIIALNRRDYTGSTLFSQAELDVLTGNDDEAHTEFLSARGLEIARFLVWVITEKKIPKASADGTSGGIALLGWSLGNVTTMAFLSHLSTYPREVVDTLEPFLRTFFMYELPDNSLGYPAPEGGYHPLEDLTIRERVRGITFGKWVSSYYAHPAYASDPPLSSGVRAIAALQVRTPKKAHRSCTLDRIAPHELLACVDAAPDTRSERPLWRLPLPVLKAQTRGALLLGPKATGSSDVTSGSSPDGGALLPALKVRVVYCLESLWSVQWETWELEKDCVKWEADGEGVRPIRFIPVKDANHFLHWEDAESFLKICLEGIRS